MEFQSTDGQHWTRTGYFPPDKFSEQETPKDTEQPPEADTSEANEVPFMAPLLFGGVGSAAAAAVLMARKRNKKQK